MTADFTVGQARALLPEVVARAETIIRVRADLADGQSALDRGSEPPRGLAYLKSCEAHLAEAIDWFAVQGIELKGIAPLIIDFPSQLHGRPVLLCWLEGETSLDWYHAPEVGFMGRRPLPQQ